MALRRLPDTWTQKTSCPGSIRFAASAFAIGPVGYITGGTDNATALNDLWAYNALTDTWSSRSAPGPSGRFGAVAFKPSVSVLIGSGCVGEQYYPGSTPGSAFATYGSDHFYRFTTSTCMTALSITICEPTNPPVTLALHLLSEDGTELEYTVKQPFQTCLEMDPFLVEPGTTYHLVIESPGRPFQLPAHHLADQCRSGYGWRRYLRRHGRLSYPARHCGFPLR
ncbi:MAG: hypothetical protein IPP33_08330 [Flavobacteriales bacterium]|nr:hypothetical protein [Flavobacteriales bacterium]